MSRKNTNRAIAAAVTVVVHVVVVVLLIKMALTTPLPLPGEAGVEVDLGMYNQGQGAVQMPKPKKVPETQSTGHKSTTIPQTRCRLSCCISIRATQARTSPFTSTRRAGRSLPDSESTTPCSSYRLT